MVKQVMTAMMSRALLITVAAVVGTGMTGRPASAQWVGEYFWGLSYDISFPLDNTNDFAPGASFRGLGLQGRKFMTPNTSLGWSASWHVFHEKTFGTFRAEPSDITGTQFRDINAWPLYVNGHYYLGERNEPRIFGGFNTGATYIDRQLEVGLFVSKKKAWQFAIAPEVGVLFPRGRLVGYLSLKYNYSFEASDVASQSYFTLNIGFAGLQ